MCNAGERTLETMKEKLGQIKEYIGKLGGKTKKLVLAGAAGVLIAAVVIALVLNNRPYEVLFSDLSTEEAQQISEKLQEDGVEYKVEDGSTILVKKDDVDATKAKLVQEGYPKSGFTYDTFINNATMMTTDSDKKTYLLYQLQDRIGATIRLFDGVRDAKVTIALAEESKYALSDAEEERSSAAATVTMKDGGSPTAEQALAIQRLVAKSVPNMEIEDVAVFDGNGNDVSGEEDSGRDSSVAEEIALVVEKQIAQKVMKVLGPIYGEDNVRVSARAKINMEQLLRETITYNTPEKIDEEDKTGIIEKEEEYVEGAGSEAAAGGVVGTETNADTPEYNTEGDADGAGAYSRSSSKEYLVDQIKEQGQVSPGALEDLTVSVALNGTGFGNLSERQLLALIGNASGIAAADQRNKIAVASAPFYESEDEGEAEKTGMLQVKPVYLVGGGVVALLLLVLLLIFLLIRKKNKKEREAEEQELLQSMAESEVAYEPLPDLNKELQEMQNDRGMELKKSIRDFAEQNPEISAQLLKNWLNGGNENGE